MLCLISTKRKPRMLVEGHQTIVSASMTHSTSWQVPLGRPSPHMHTLTTHNVACRFHIIGGECNYLLRFSPVTKRLEFVPDKEWMTPCMQQWRQEDIQYVLREAEKLLMDTAYRLRLPIKVQPCSQKPCCCCCCKTTCCDTARTTP